VVTAGDVRMEAGRQVGSNWSSRQGGLEAFLDGWMGGKAAV
jgi:hypothetical protein